MTQEEKVTRAEIKILLKSIQKNLSFEFHKGSADLFKDCFSDSLIAQSYQMGRTKATYVTVHGLAPYLMKHIIKDMEGSPFRYQFDESTNVQIKKQYDAYVFYFSSSFGKFVSHYLGTLFVGHCSSKDLISHFYKFEEKIKWDSQYLLQVSMDGPSVNLAFKRELEKDFAAKQKTFIDLPTCTIHKLHNSFKECITAFKFINVNGFLHDLHFFLS